MLLVSLENFCKILTVYQLNSLRGCLVKIRNRYCQFKGMGIYIIGGMVEHHSRRVQGLNLLAGCFLSVWRLLVLPVSVWVSSRYFLPQLKNLHVRLNCDLKWECLCLYVWLFPWCTLPLALCELGLASSPQQPLTRKVVKIMHRCH